MNRPTEAGTDERLRGRRTEGRTDQEKEGDERIDERNERTEGRTRGRMEEWKKLRTNRIKDMITE